MPEYSVKANTENNELTFGILLLVFGIFRCCKYTDACTGILKYPISVQFFRYIDPRLL